MENNFYEKYPAYNKPLVELQREREILEGRYGNDSIALKKNSQNTWLSQCGRNAM